MGGGVYGPGYQSGSGSGMGGVMGGGYGPGNNLQAEAASRDYAMEMIPPTRDRMRANQGVAFRTDLSKVGGAGAKNQKIFGGGGPVNQAEEESRLITKVFSICDKDNSGSIDVKELKELLLLCGVDSTFIESSIDRIMANVDSDFDGNISPQEFHQVLSQRFEEGDSREDILKVFAKMDENKDKFLDADELMKVSSYMGENLSQEEVEDMIKVFSIDYQQKMEVFNSKPRTERKKDEKPPPAPTKMTEEDFIAVMHKRLGQYNQQQEGMQNM